MLASMCRKGNLYTVSINVNWYSHCGKWYGKFKKLKSRVTILPSNSTAGYIPRNIHLKRYTHTHTHTHTSQAVIVVKNPLANQCRIHKETWVWSLGWEEPLEEVMVTHSSIPAWRIPWTGAWQVIHTHRHRHRHRHTQTHTDTHTHTHTGILLS